MLQNSAAGAIAAKVKTMYRRRLGAQDYSQLAAKRNIAEIVSYLKNETGYSGALQHVQETGIHRHQLEFLLHKNFYRVYERLQNYAPDSETSFYDYPKNRAELSMLVSSIEYVTSPTHTDFVAVLPLYLDRHLSFDAMALGQVSSYAGIVEVMKRSRYYDTLKRLTPPVGVRLDFLSCEFALRMDYYRWLFEAIDHLPKGARGAVRQHFSELAELVNISNIYRMKRFYHMPPTRIAELVFPYYGKISEKQMRTLIDANDINAFWEALSRTAYAGDFAGEGRSFAEDVTHRIRHRESRRAFRFNNDPAMAYATYMTLLETEIDNIILIVEGVSFGLEPGEITRLLIT